MCFFFLLTPCLVVAIQPCMGRIPIKKKKIPCWKNSARFVWVVCSWSAGWMGLLLRKNHLLRCCGWLSLPNWIRTLTLSLLLNLPPRKLKPWFVLSFLLLRLLCISIKHRPYSIFRVSLYMIHYNLSKTEK